MGTFSTCLPSERMILSSLTISARFFLMASLIFSLWRSWSMLPLRWSDQSGRVTGIGWPPLEEDWTDGGWARSGLPTLHREKPCLVETHSAHLAVQEAASVLEQFIGAHVA